MTAAGMAGAAPWPLPQVADDNTFAGGRDTGNFRPSPLTFGIHQADWRIGERPEVIARPRYLPASRSS